MDYAGKIADAVRRHIEFDEERTTMMDCACGSGLISQALAPYCKQIVGVDIDRDLVEQYNTQVSNQGIPFEEMRAVCQNLMEGPGELDGRQFDIVLCVRAYHHFSDIAAVTRTLSSFLKPDTGILAVVDLVKGEHHFHRPSRVDPRHMVAHRGGFDEGDIRIAFEAAQLDKYSFKVLMEVVSHGHTAELFLAQGTRRGNTADVVQT